MVNRSRCFGCILIALACLLAAGGLPGVETVFSLPPKRPNILLIITDQQHAGMLTCAGNSYLKTPAMDGS
jgi:hypothetical protein